MSTKFKIEKNKGFTMMSNHHLRNKKLTLKAKGLMSFMLSLPDTWDYTEMGLVSVLKEGRESIRSGLKELEDYGYLVRDKKSRTDGKFGGYDYSLYETPHRVRFTDTDKPSTVKPMSVNRTQISTDLITTDKQVLSNIKEIYKENENSKLGEFKNVVLNQEEINKLKSRLVNYTEYIERLSSYLASSGKKYKSHYAVILTWARKAGDLDNGSDKGFVERI